LNAKQAKKLRRAAKIVFMEKLEDCAALAASSGVDMYELAKQVPHPHTIYKRAKAKLRRQT